MVNSGPFDGTPSVEGKGAVVEYGEERGFAKGTVTYRLRDWLISRQRYWGTPIPIIYCPDCGTVPVPEDDLPVLLPEDAEFVPTGESPLKLHDGFRNVELPAVRQGRRARDRHDGHVHGLVLVPVPLPEPALRRGARSTRRRRDWLPVDQYTGGIEHATMHLLYFRFFTKAMRDLGLIDFDEPRSRLFNQGIILGPDGEKMSKSRGNVVNPDDYVDTLGADTFRCYLMFIGPWSEGGPYRPEGIDGIARWLNRVWSRRPGAAAERRGRRGRRRASCERQRHQHDPGRHATTWKSSASTRCSPRLMEFTNGLLRAREAGNVARDRLERGGRDAAADDGAGRAAHRRRAVGAHRATRTASTSSPGRPADAVAGGVRDLSRWSSRSTARCATSSTCRSTSATTRRARWRWAATRCGPLQMGIP